ncbi:MAG: CHASE2 domain-containing protein, partial [Alphaproteobacteria bacterium]|nr:CHASE2 domain-containing protein [Alphaproteobacteria bacterium]
MLMRILTNRWLHTFILIGILAAAVTLKVREYKSHNPHDYQWVRSLGNVAFDLYNELNPRTPTDMVVMVDIDETSMERPELGQWPWSRDMMAKLVSNLHALGARAIVFDMVFPESDRTSPGVLLDRIPLDQRPPDIEALIGAMPDNDDLFAQAIKDAGNVVTAFVWTSDAKATRRTPPTIKPINMRGPAAQLSESVPHITGAVTNLPLFSEAAAGEGSFGVIPDVDGIIRRVPLLFRYEDPTTGKTIVYPSLAIEALRVYHSAKSLINVRALKSEEVGEFDPPLTMKVGNFEVPLDWDGLMNGYFTPARPRQYIPAWRVINDEVAAERISGKIVFVGTSAEGLRDIRSTPLNLYIPGV